MLATFQDAFETDAARDAVRFVETVLLVATLALLATHFGVADAVVTEFVPLVVGSGGGGVLDWLIIY
jgi:hypothetical protein